MLSFLMVYSSSIKLSEGTLTSDVYLCKCDLRRFFMLVLSGRCFENVVMTLGYGEVNHQI
ncbi:hypothetical protein HMPREF3197_05423 [Klebsiella pneumoniae]|nr:hypothetical protein HMPREF3197_05423 [Klebsiella pneumoniae]